VRQQVELRLLRHPVGLEHRASEPIQSRNLGRGTRDASAATVDVPAPAHLAKLPA
jgi:hypothetical protein